MRQIVVTEERNTSYRVQDFIIFSHINKTENLRSVTPKLAESGNGSVDFLKSVVTRNTNLFFRKPANKKMHCCMWLNKRNVIQIYKRRQDCTERNTILRLVTFSSRSETIIICCSAMFLHENNAVRSVKYWVSCWKFKFPKANFTVIKGATFVTACNKIHGKNKGILFKMGRRKLFWYYIVVMGSAVSYLPFLL